MKLKLICVGKNAERYIIEGIDEYYKRIKKYLSFEIIYLKDVQKTKNTDIGYVKTREGELILRGIENNDIVILLDEKGELSTSLKFSKDIEKMMVEGSKNVVFIIGGAFGFSDEVYKRGNKVISLSKMTFPHQLIRIIFMEQLYRAFTIIKNEPYHNE